MAANGRRVEDIFTKGLRMNFLNYVQRLAEANSQKDTKLEKFAQNFKT